MTIFLKFLFLTLWGGMVCILSSVEPFPISGYLLISLLLQSDALVFSCNIFSSPSKAASIRTKFLFFCNECLWISGMTLSAFHQSLIKVKLKFKFPVQNCLHFSQKLFNMYLEIS